MTIEELAKIRDAALLKGFEAHNQAVKNCAVDSERASDYGMRARHWERLADAADALHALLSRDDDYEAAGIPVVGPHIKACASVPRLTDAQVAKELWRAEEELRTLKDDLEEAMKEPKS